MLRNINRFLSKLILSGLLALSLVDLLNKASAQVHGPFCRPLVHYGGYYGGGYYRGYYAGGYYGWGIYYGGGPYYRGVVVHSTTVVSAAPAVAVGVGIGPAVYPVASVPVAPVALVALAPGYV